MLWLRVNKTVVIALGILSNYKTLEMTSVNGALEYLDVEWSIRLHLGGGISR